MSNLDHPISLHSVCVCVFWRKNLLSCLNLYLLEDIYTLTQENSKYMYFADFFFTKIYFKMVQLTQPIIVLKIHFIFLKLDFLAYQLSIKPMLFLKYQNYLFLSFLCVFFTLLMEVEHMHGQEKYKYKCSWNW